ncbi:MAG TPA: VCBS repeat-containing protein, partial [Pontiella sp.]|nr:VCBS repeat-containing protein [Pontiella sp.]
MLRGLVVKWPAALLWVPVLVTADVGFERHVVYTGGVVHSAQAVDYNADGLKDLVFTAEGGVNIALAPSFEVRRICDTPKPLKPNSYHSAVMDVDGDGDMDFLGENNGLYWLECPEDPLSSPWKLHWITRAFTGIHCITIQDVDEDGRLDIVVNNYWHRHQRKTIPNQYPASIVWFSIPVEPGNPEAWVPRILADGDAVGGSHYMAFADLDDDGHDEILVGAKGFSLWSGNYFAYWS